jgi:DNA-binding HxlR family transcriptional regulator
MLLSLTKLPLRFNQLRHRIEGISQKMLTQTLRNLERDGLVKRQAFATVPVTVEYSITPLGRTLATTVDALRQWADILKKFWLRRPITTLSATMNPISKPHNAPVERLRVFFVLLPRSFGSPLRPFC